MLYADEKCSYLFVFSNTRIINMGLTVSSWARTVFSGQFQQSYQEADKIGNERVNYKFMPGTTSCVDPFISNRIAAHTNGTLSNSTTVESGVTTTVDNILVNHEYVPDYVINTNGGEVPREYASKLGAGLAATRQICLTSFIAQNAIAASQTETFDSEDTTGAAIYSAIENIYASMRNADVPETDIFCGLSYRYCMLLRKYAPAGSRDYVGEGVNRSPLDPFVLHGITFIPMRGCFSTDLTASPYSTKLAAKYQYDFLGTSSDDNSLLGVMWHRDAVRCLEVMKPEVEITPWAAEQSQLVTARLHMGTGSLRSAAQWCIYGDSNNT